MDKAILYIHGKGGNPKEAEYYKALFEEYDVIGFDYSSQLPWAEWKRNRERSQNTGYRRHHANQRHPFGCKVRFMLRFCGKCFTHDMDTPFL